MHSLAFLLFTTLAQINSIGKGKGAHAGAYISRFPYHEACLGVLLHVPPPGRDASPSQGYPPAVYLWYPFMQLGEERQSGVKFLV